MTAVCKAVGPSNHDMVIQVIRNSRSGSSDRYRLEVLQHPYLQNIRYAWPTVARSPDLGADHIGGYLKSSLSTPSLTRASAA